MHRVGTGEVVPDLRDGPALRIREREGQEVVERLDQGAVDLVTDAPRFPLEGSLTHDEGELESEQFVEREPAAGVLRVVHRVGQMDLTERPIAVDDREFVSPRVIEWVEHPTEFAKADDGLLDRRAEVPRGQARLLRLRIDRHNAAGAVANQVDDGIRHLPAALVEVDLPEEHGLGPDRELLAPPSLVEERALEVARSVEEVNLHEGPTLTSAAGRVALHLGQDHRLLAHPEVFDLRLVGAVEITTGVMGDEVEHALDRWIEVGQRLGLLVAHAGYLRDGDLLQRRQRPARHERATRR